MGCLCHVTSTYALYYAYVRTKEHMAIWSRMISGVGTTGAPGAGAPLCFFKTYLCTVILGKNTDKALSLRGGADHCDVR